MSALLLIGICFLICLIATPFLAVIWLLQKYSRWVTGVVNGDAKPDTSKEILKLLEKLIVK